MADNVAITAGTGTSIATDDIAGVHYQRVKLALGADGAAADAAVGGGTEATALRVTIASDSTGVVSVDDNGGSLTVDGTVSVTGVSTATNQTTIIGHLDGVEGLLTTIDADTSALAGAVKAEDAAHTTGDTGIMALAVRSDTLAARAGTTGDYTPLQVDAQGAVYSRIVSSSGATIDPQTDDAAFTAGTSIMSVVGGIATTDSVDSGDAGAFAMTLARAIHATLKTDTAGGPSIFRSLDIDESEEEIKASAGQIYWIHAVNLTADPVYLKFYNATAANVTVGTTTPVLTFPVVSQGTTDGAGFVFNVPQGIPFGTAITVAATTGVADADTGAPGANACVINIGYS